MSTAYSISIQQTTVTAEEVGDYAYARVSGLVKIFGQQKRTSGTYKVTVNGTEYSASIEKYFVQDYWLYIYFKSPAIRLTMASGTNYIPATLEFSQTVRVNGTWETASGSKTRNDAIKTYVQPLPDWATPVTNRTEGARITATDMNRIAGNICILENRHIAKYDHTTSDFVTQNDWNAIIEQTNEYAEELGITGVTTSSRWDNFNRIEEITKLYSEA